MGYLDKMRNEFGEVKRDDVDIEYDKAVAVLKKHIKAAFERKEKFCLFYTTPECMDKIMKNPEFEGCRFNAAKNPSTKPGNIGKCVSWD